MSSSRFITAVLVLMTMSSASAVIYNSAIKSSNWAKDQRLPTAIVPISYWVTLKPDVHFDKFSGSVEINIKCKETTNIIILHAHDSLHIDTKFVILTPQWKKVTSAIETAEQMMFSNSMHPNIANIERNTTTDEFVITLVEPMQIGEIYTLYVQFSGEMKLYDSKQTYEEEYMNCGFIIGNYSVTSKSLFAMTDMSLNCARRVFPCFDEPSFKASFRISVARPRNMTTVSVMSVESSEQAEGDWIWDHFEPSPPISTFSINIFISELKPGKTTHITTSRGKYSIQYHGSPYLNKTMDDRQNLFPRMIQFLEDYLAMAFPVPKLDIVTLPDSFVYRELNTFGTTFQMNYMKGYEFLYLVPSLVDQWVLHTVTPQWWNNVNISNTLGLYLTKATLVNVTGNPVWQAVESYQMYNMLSDPNLLQYSGDMDIVADMIKGDWFLQMLRTSITENTFKKGINNFLIKNVHKTVNDTMLWDMLSKQAWKDETIEKDISVLTIANSWLQKQLFPVVTMNRNYEENSATLEQHVFMKDYSWLIREYGSETYDSLSHNWTEQEKQMKWWIPVSYLTPHDTGISDWMKEEQQINVTNLPDHNEFAIINPTDSGMFLVNYDQQNWNLIMQSLVLQDRKLPTVTRKKVLQDASLLATNGNLSYVTFLNMSLCLFNETEVTVWQSFVSAMSKDLDRKFSMTPIQQKLYQYLRKLVTPFYNSLNISFDEINNEAEESSPEDIYTKMIYYNIQYFMTRIGYQPYINKTHEMMENKLSTYPVEDAQSGLIVFCPHFLNESEDIDLMAYAAKLDRYSRQLDFGYEMFWRSSISVCPGYKRFIYKILSGSLDGKNTYEDTDWEIMKTLMTTNLVAQDISLNFLLQNFEKLKIKSRTSQEIEFMKTVMSKVRSEEQLQMILHFYHQHEHDTGLIHHIVTKSIKEAYKTVEWNKQHLAGISHWFDKILPKFMHV